MGKHNRYEKAYTVTLPLIAVNAENGRRLTWHLPDDLTNQTVELVANHNTDFSEAVIAAILAEIFNKRKAKDIFVHGGTHGVSQTVIDLKNKYYSL